MKFVNLCGLPRSGSTLLGNVLNQHPDITAEMDSCLADIVVNISQHSSKVYEETQHTINEMKELYRSFLRSGIIGWMSKLSDTEIYLDKDRAWALDFDLLFNLIPNAKVIFIVRDLRGVVSSMERTEVYDRILPKYNGYDFEDRSEYNETDLMDLKVSSFIESDMIYTPLFGIKEVLDCEKYYLKNFKFVRYEDLIEDPRKVLSEIYNFIGIDYFENDLNDIKQGRFHDAIYAPYGNHTINKKLTPKKETYKFPLIKKKTQLKILNDYSWFYRYFYPNLYGETLN